MQRFLVSQGEYRAGPAVEYVRKFDQLSRYALDMVQPKMGKVWRFQSGLRPGRVRLVDTGRDGPKSYANVVGHAIRHESWMKTKKNVSLGVSGGLK